MAVIKIHEVVLYTSGFANPVACHEAAAWFDHSNIEHMKLHYNDPSQEGAVLSALNTWWSHATVDGWPFVTFREEHDDRPITQMTANFIEGLEDIKAQLPALYALGR